MGTDEELVRIGKMLDEIEAALEGVTVEEATASELRTSTATLRRALERWRAETPSAAVVEDLAATVADVLEKARVARRAWQLF